jgi:nitroreductase
MSVLSVGEAIQRRRSVRAFLPDEVPEAILRSALELAQLAPSNCNAQPWTPHVVSGEALVRLRADLIDAGMREERSNLDWPLDGQYSGVHRERQIDAAVQLYGAMGVGRREFVA